MRDDALSVRELHVRYANGVHAVRGVDIDLAKGECLGLIGESGCGKTTVARAVLGLLPSGTGIEGDIRIGGRETIGLSAREMDAIRGLSVGFVSQDPYASFNPIATISRHMAEPWLAHRMAVPAGAVERGISALGIYPANAAAYPHQWSGGMLQRASIAAAAAHEPPLIISDEPTSAVDADRSDSILSALTKTGAGLLLISHDLLTVGRRADRIAVCYAGRIVALGPSDEILGERRHPYLRALVEALPRPGWGLPTPIEGTPPRLDRPIVGCPFQPRCQHSIPSCLESEPTLVDGTACGVFRRAGGSPPLNEAAAAEGTASRGAYRDRSLPILRARSLSKRYEGRGGTTYALVDADLSVEAGEIVGISGASGCGKSTLLRLLGGIEPPDSGAVELEGRAFSSPERKRRGASDVGGRVMPIFQDPVSSLDRRWPIWRTVTEPLLPGRAFRGLGKNAYRELAREALSGVGLGHLDIDARPSNLSVGQCQRVSIARALIAKPKVILADEPTSALDASIAAAILRLLAKASGDGIAIVMVSHDEAALRCLCDRVVRMEKGALLK